MKDKIKFIKTSYPYRGGVLKAELIKLREHKCESCGLTTWQNQPIPLEAHHIDGDKTNNTLENLQLLCPNCHTLTINYGSKNIKKHNDITDDELILALQTQPSIRQALFSLGMSDAGANYERVRILITNHPELTILNDKIISNITRYKKCPNCGKNITMTAKLCPECAAKASRIVERPERQILQAEVYNTSFTALGQKYNVSDNAIKKWCIYYKLPYRRKDINKYTYDEWMAL